MSTIPALSRRLFICALLFSCSSALLRADEDEPSKGGPPELRQVKYRLIGPAAGGRVCRVAGVPGDPLTYYAATAAGGVWKSGDGGHSWKPTFDDQPASSIGSLAIAPSDPNVIYAGTGEANIRGNVVTGSGIYKSTDAGRTWRQVWKQEGQIGAMIVHPRNPNTAYAAVFGHAFGPNRERGVYRTTDGGQTWKQLLAKDADTGASDVCFDPSNPHILFAGLWQARRRPWEMTSGGPGSGLYRSADGGDTWTQLTHSEALSEHWGKGLPEGIWGKVGVAVAPSNGQRVYALIEAEKGGLFRSDDGGQNWTRVNAGHYLRQRAWYYSTLTIDPSNADAIWCPQVRMFKSIDGGKTFQNVKGFHHGDHHDIWIDPRNPKRMIDGNDGGVDLSMDGGQTWRAPHLPISQFYHVAVDTRTPYFVSGAMQDLGTACGPSNSLASNGILLSDWYDVGGGEAGYTAHDPSDPNIIYAGEYGGTITRFDFRTRQSRVISSYLADISGHGAEDMRYRFQWTAPIVVSPHDPKVVYHAGNVLFKTTDGGQSWTAISGDLTRNDRTKQKWSGGPITGDNTGAEYYCTIFAVAESPRQKDLIWAGSDDGLIHVTQDGGRNWSNVTKNIPGMPEWGTVACIEASPFDAGTAYLVVDAHRLDDMRPYLFKTTDYGKTWKSLTSQLPQDVYLHALREDPRRKGLLYAGTEHGVSISRDDGATWQELKLNLPTTPVHDLQVKENDLVVGTHGRSVWILDDLTALREWSPEIAAKDVHLFTPLVTQRYLYHANFGGKGIGANPPPGAVIYFTLKGPPKDDITLEVLDAEGKQVVLLKSKPKPKKPKPNQRDVIEKRVEEEDPDAREEKYKLPVLKTEAGVNRVVWNLRYKGADVIPNAKIDEGDPEAGPLVNPGTYTLKLTVDGKTETASLTVVLDPRERLADSVTRTTSFKLNGQEAPSQPPPSTTKSPAVVTRSGLDESLRLALAVRNDISRLAMMVNQVRTIRRQLEERDELLQDDPRAESIRKAAEALIEKLDELEAKLQNPRAEVTYDILAQRGGAQLYSQLGFLYETLKDPSGSPTQGMRERYAELSRELEKYSGELKSLVSGDLAKINSEAQKLAILGVIVPEKKASAKQQD
jgi:photosystem II stability/assembly factor-like uncharacterized protein